MNEDIMVSVCCVTYNHGKYISKALDGILAQKVNFKYQVIIGEDCSTDNTRQVLEDYQKRYPGVFDVIYQQKNVGSKLNSKSVVDKAVGKYIIYLEMDDYWTDEYKLQTQVDILEADETVIAVAHNCKVVDGDGNASKFAYPECKKNVYNLKHYRRWILPGQTSTIMYRNYYRDKGILDADAYYKARNMGPGDRINVFALASRGKIVCLQKPMCVYRYVTKGGSSFSATNTHKYRDYMEQFKELVNAAEKCGVDEELLFTAYFMYYEALYATFLLQRDMSLVEFKERRKKIKNKGRCSVNLMIHVLCRVWRDFKHII